MLLDHQGRRPRIHPTAYIAPTATVCCNACRTCVQTNLIALALAAVVGAGAWVAGTIRRPTTTP